MSKMDNVLKGYEKNILEEEINNITKKLIEKSSENNNNKINKFLFNCLDITSLNQVDNELNIENLIEKINNLKNVYSEIGIPAAICIYPSLIKKVKNTLKEDIKIASVAGGFPNSQTFIEVKIAETGLCILEGANEIDIVISVGKAIEEDYETIAEEIQQIKESCEGKAILKVILETGALKDYNKIYKTAITVMEAGADFIKTSTGKIEPAATYESFIVMCKAINDFYKKTNKKIGIKAAGGIREINDATIYYTIVKELLGKEWLNKELFRIGASKLANNIINKLYNNKINYF